MIAYCIPRFSDKGGPRKIDDFNLYLQAKGRTQFEACSVQDVIESLPERSEFGATPEEQERNIRKCLDEKLKRQREELRRAGC